MIFRGRCENTEGNELGEYIWEICNKILRAEKWIKDWSEGLIVPIRKKEKGERVGNYKEITLAPTLYKVYAMILAEKLEEEVERKGLIL